jgi:hypothetical protein
MVESTTSGLQLDENGMPIIKAQDIIKEGYLNKQSRYWKSWRK